MIHTPRPATAPASLGTAAVQQYLAACAVWQTAYAAWQVAPVTTPPTPPPVPPVKTAEYRTADLLDAFDAHFHAKCYLTEQWFGSSREMDVDHFEPANQNPARVYDWTNLLPIAHKANLMRPKSLPVGGLLDPCVDDVEGDIRYSLAALGEAPGFQARDPTDQRAANTAALLDYLHNGDKKKPDSVQATRHLRVLIEKKYKLVKDWWGQWNSARARQDAHDILDAETELRALLSRTASFTMLIRSERWIRKELTHLFD